MDEEGFGLARTIGLVLFVAISASAGLSVGALLSAMVRRARDDAERKDRDYWP